MLARLSFILLVLALAGCGSSSAGPATPTPGAPAHVGAIPQTSPVSTLPPTPKSGGGHGKPVTHLPTVKPVVPPTPTPFPPQAFTATIFGTVTDATSHSPITGAVVSVANGRRITKTDAFGDYTIKFPCCVGVPVTVTREGYAQSLAMGTMVPFKKLRVNFKLTREIPGTPVPPAAPSVFNGH
jgi:hypothetical protein